MSINPNSKQINYEKRIVAFVDILGFKQIIKDSETNKNKLRIIHQALNFLKNQEKPGVWGLQLAEMEEDAQKRRLTDFDLSKRTSCTCFSDSIVISVRADDNKVNEVTSTMIANLSYIGAKLLTEGILLRGAMTIGKLIHTDSGIIMGQALIEAYELETNVAKHARIVISKKLLDQLNYPITTKRDRYPYHQYLNRFEDGCVGFHQMIYFQVLQSWTGMKKGKLKSDLKKVKQTIIQGLDSAFQFPDTYDKFRWLKFEYDKIIILTDGVKQKIYEINENISGQNIHYSYTDKFYQKRRTKRPVAK